MSLYAADGSWNVTVVDGTTFTGLYAPDGSYNVVEVDGTTLEGLYNPCGAYNVYLTDGTYTGYYHPCGALNVSVSPYVASSVKVTAVSGDLGNDPLAPGEITGTITWDTLPTDTTPGFGGINLPSGNGAPLDAAEDDDLVGEYQVNGAGAWVEWLRHALTASEIIDDTISASGGTPMVDGVHPTRFRLERDGHIGPNITGPTVTIDATAPTLSSATGTETGETTASLSVSTNEGNGTLYWVVDQSATPPSAAQVKAGNDQGGGAADDSGSQAVSGTGVQNISGGATGLTGGTGYYAYYMHEDQYGNQSSVAASSQFTTESAAATISYVTRGSDSTNASSYSGGALNGVSIGTAATGRIVVLCIHGSCIGCSPQTNAPTINGNAMTLVARNSSTYNVSAIYKYQLDTGTTADFVINFTGTASRMGYVVFAIYGANATETDTATNTSGSAATLAVGSTLDVPTDGVGIVFASANVNGAMSWSAGSPTDAGSPAYVTIESTQSMIAGYYSATASASPAASWTGAGPCSIAAAAWGP